jgi:hypothetical protein
MSFFFIWYHGPRLVVVDDVAELHLAWSAPLSWLKLGLDDVLLLPQPLEY